MGRFWQLNDKEWLYNQYVRKKNSTRYIANIVGCSFPTVNRALKKHKIPIRKPSDRSTWKSKFPLLNERDYLIRRYIDEGSTQEDIAIEIGCSIGAVAKARERLKIPIKDIPEVRRHSKWKSKKYNQLDDKDWLCNKYLVGKLCIHDIAQIVGCCDTAVKCALKRHGVQKRTKSEALSLMNQKPSIKKMRRRIGKKNWEDPDFIKKVMAGLHAKPNKLEQKVDKILQKYFPNEWRYNGDFSQGVVLGGMIPDFVNVNGKKAVIEVFGDFYHDPSKAFWNVEWKKQEFGRVSTYSQLGFKCIILWGSDIKGKGAEDFIINKLNKEYAGGVDDR